MWHAYRPSPRNALSWPFSFITLVNLREHGHTCGATLACRLHRRNQLTLGFTHDYLDLWVRMDHRNSSDRSSTTAGLEPGDGPGRTNSGAVILRGSLRGTGGIFFGNIFRAGVGSLFRFAIRHGRIGCPRSRCTECIALQLISLSTRPRRPAIHLLLPPRQLTLVPPLIRHLGIHSPQYMVAWVRRE
jgi:hypothetical protein